MSSDGDDLGAKRCIEWLSIPASHDFPGQCVTAAYIDADFLVLALILWFAKSLYMRFTYMKLLLLHLLLRAFYLSIDVKFDIQ